MWLTGKARGFVVRPNLRHHSSGLGKPLILSLLLPPQMGIIVISTSQISYEAQLKLCFGNTL